MSIDSYKGYLRSCLTFWNVSVFLSLQLYQICVLPMVEYFEMLLFFIPMSPFPLPLFKLISSFVHITSRQMGLSRAEGIYSLKAHVFLFVCLSCFHGYQDYLGELSKFTGGRKRIGIYEQEWSILAKKKEIIFLKK